MQGILIPLYSKAFNLNDYFNSCIVFYYSQISKRSFFSSIKSEKIRGRDVFMAATFKLVVGF